MKKYLFFILLFICLGILIINNVSAKYHFPLLGKTIFLDIGHGGLDPGTTYNGVYEKDLNLKIGIALKNKLEEYGAAVIIDRDGDYDLASPNAMYRKKSDFDNRINMINNSNADLYISIHLNFLNDSRYYGPQVFYKKGDEKLANTVQDMMNKKTNSNRNIKYIPNDTYMYKKLLKKGLLIECGFLSNSVDRKNLQDEKYQIILSSSIADAIVLYYN